MNCCRPHNQVCNLDIYTALQCFTAEVSNLPQLADRREREGEAFYTSACTRTHKQGHKHAQCKWDASTHVTLASTTPFCRTVLTPPCFCRAALGFHRTVARFCRAAPRLYRGSTSQGKCARNWAVAHRKYFPRYLINMKNNLC